MNGNGTNGLLDTALGGLRSTALLMMECGRSMWGAGGPGTGFARLLERGCPSSCGCGGGEGHGGSFCRSCEVPAPPWIPRCVGTVNSFVCPGSTARLRLQVRSESSTKRRVSLELGPRALEGVTPGTTFSLSPAELALGPLQIGTSVARVNIPETSRLHDVQDFLLWVRGCREQYIQWRVTVLASAVCTLQTIEVVECQDFAHEWSDHFYCAHPCHSEDGYERPR